MPNSPPPRRDLEAAATSAAGNSKPIPRARVPRPSTKDYVSYNQFIAKIN
jgi:hypothetical protein